MNAEHFKLACTNLERLLAALRAPHRGGTLRLDASSHFTATLDIAQARIDSAIGAKLLEFIELEEMDWTRASDPPSGRAQPSSYIFEMLTWLETMMESVLVLLPRETKLRAYRSAFRYVASQLLDGQLLAREVEKVSPPGLRQLQRDVEALCSEGRRLVSATAGGGGSGPGDAANGAAPATPTSPALDVAQASGLVDTIWAEARQTIAIALGDNASSSGGGVTEYLSPTARSTSLREAQPAKVAGVLDRLGKWHLSRGEQEIAARRFKERDQVGRILRR